MNQAIAPKLQIKEGIPVYDYLDCVDFCRAIDRLDLWVGWYYGQTGLLSEGKGWVYDYDWERFVRGWLGKPHSQTVDQYLDGLAAAAAAAAAAEKGKLT